MTTLLDSFSEINQDNQFSIKDVWPYAVGHNAAGGQSFTTPNDGITYKLTSAKFYMEKVGSPVGNMVARLHTHSGVYGTSSKPADSSILATSGTINANTLGETYALVEFTFTGVDQYAMSPNTYYCIGVGYLPSGSTIDDSTNYIQVGMQVTASNLHDGNEWEAYDDTWYLDGGDYDVCFYVYGEAQGGGVVIRSNSGNILSKLIDCGILQMRRRHSWNNLFSTRFIPKRLI